MACSSGCRLPAPFLRPRETAQLRGPRAQMPPSACSSQIGTTLSTGEFIFGTERGRMPLQSAEVSMETAQEGGQTWHHITLTSYLDGVSHDSGVYKAISTIAIGLGAGNDRFRAVLRTTDGTLAQEWVAVLKYACGFQRERETHRLLEMIAAGDTQEAGALAEDLARQAATAPRDRTRSSVAQLELGKSRERRPSDETFPDAAGMSDIREELPITTVGGVSIANDDSAGRTHMTDDGAASVASESGDEDDLTTLSAASAAAGKRSKFAAQALALEQQNRELLQRLEELLQVAPLNSPLVSRARCAGARAQPPGLDQQIPAWPCRRRVCCSGSSRRRKQLCEGCKAPCCRWQTARRRRRWQRAAAFPSSPSAAWLLPRVPCTSNAAPPPPFSASILPNSARRPRRRLARFRSTRRRRSSK